MAAIADRQQSPILTFDKPPFAAPHGVSVSGVANEAFRLDVELRFDPIDHRLGALDFCGSMSRCGFHIHDHAVLDIDQITRGVSVERWATWSCGPARLRISQR